MNVYAGEYENPAIAGFFVACLPLNSTTRHGIDSRLWPDAFDAAGNIETMSA